jgi:FMN reductase
VLVEIGASCPAPGLYLIDKDYETSPRLGEWRAIARRYTQAVAA